MRRIKELEAKLTQADAALTHEKKLHKRDINELARVNADNKRLQAKLTHYHWLSINSNLEGDG